MYRLFKSCVLVSVGALCGSSSNGFAAGPVVNSDYHEPVVVTSDHGRIRLVQATTQPVQSADPTELQATGGATFVAEESPFAVGTQGASFFPSVADDATAVSAATTVPASAASASISGATTAIKTSLETSQALAGSPTTATVTAQRRNPISFDPHIRGYRFGQIYAQSDGALWNPVRTDLDTFLSKLTPSLIDNVNVISGPYGVRYGPGLAFIDIQTLGTPRYQNGYETHYGIAANYRENGDQFYGTTTVIGGDSYWGYRVNYGNRNGSDYDSGDGTQIPSSYQAQTLLGQFGVNITEYSRMEFRYQHLDQNDTEYALQFFDLDYLGTNAYSINYVSENPQAQWTRLNVDVWHNLNNFHGDNLNASKAPIRNRVEAALVGAGAFVAGDTFEGRTFGRRSNFGTRAMVTYGEDSCPQLRMGADVRYEEQRIQEDFTREPPVAGDPNFPIRTELPNAWKADPGLFAELVLPTRPYWTTTVGGRVDFVRTDAQFSDLGNVSNIVDPTMPVDLREDDVLYAFFATTNLELTDTWSVRGGFGHGQRAPTLIERYADGVFLGLTQSGFSRFNGNAGQLGDAGLDPERAWQADASVYANYETFRGRASAFYSWVEDFVTFQANPITAPAAARVLQFINTDRVRFLGFELYGEKDMNDWLTAFGSVNYVDGEDKGINQPIWGVAPFEGSAGLRLHDPDGGRYWGLEAFVRAVDGQDRNASVRLRGAPGLVQIEEQTPGFTTVGLRGYWNYSDNLTLIGGVENLFDNNYIEHLDLRVPAETIAGTFFPAQDALSPGTTVYGGFEWSR